MIGASTSVPPAALTSLASSGVGGHDGFRPREAADDEVGGSNSGRWSLGYWAKAKGLGS